MPIKCPVHDFLLNQANIPYIRTWFCPKCEAYYILPTSSRNALASIQGKAVRILDFKYQAIVDETEKEVRRQIEADLRLQQNIEQLKKKYNPIAVFKRPFYTQPLLKSDNPVCPFCNEPLSENAIVQIMIYKDKMAHHKILRVLPCCKQCHTPFLLKETYQSLFEKLRSQTQMLYVFNPKLCHSKKELLKVAQFVSNNRDKQAPPIPDPPKYPFDLPTDYQTIFPNISFLKSGKYIWLYAKKCHCYTCLRKYKTDTIRSRTALVQTLSGATVKVNVEYCIGCGEYYMNVSSLKAYNKKYGAILAEFSSLQHGKNFGWDGFDSFNPDSVLSRCGYNARVGTPKEYRQAIISFVLDSGKATKWELLELLKSFINVHWYSHPGACDRWQEDILFINDYKIQTQKVVSGLTFRQGK